MNKLIVFVFDLWYFLTNLTSENDLNGQYVKKGYENGLIMKAFGVVLEMPQNFQNLISYIHTELKNISECISSNPIN